MAKPYSPRSRYGQIIVEAAGNKPLRSLAREWGVPYHVVYDAARGKAISPSMRHLPRIAEGLGLSVSELVRRLE